MNNNLTYQEATTEAAHETSTANELDIIVSKTRQINLKRDRDLKRMETLLNNIEQQVSK